MLVYPATAEEGDKFFANTWPAARAVADPEGQLFSRFGVSRASLRQIFGPSVWQRLREARKKGFRGRLPVGNPWLLPGMFLVQGDEVLWQYYYRNIGDHPDLLKLLTEKVGLEASGD